MASSDNEQWKRRAEAHSARGGAVDRRQDAPAAVRYTSDDIARLRNGSRVFPVTSAGSSIRRHLDVAKTNEQRKLDERAYRKRTAVCLVVCVLLFFLSLCPMGAAGQYYANTTSYTFFSPVEVINCIYLHIYQFMATTTHAFDAHTGAWLTANAPGYWAFEKRFMVVCITAVCGILLSISGMLFQNVFKNPIAGPGMLGVSSGVSIGLMVLVYLYGAEAEVMVQTRYAYCYGFGLAVLVIVMAIGAFISRKGRGLNLMTLLLAGMILGQLSGFVVSYVTLFVMEPDTYLIYFNLAQMLVVNTEPLAWICLAVAVLASIIPVYLLRFRLNGLSYNELEARTLGIDLTKLRFVALICGSIMILTALIHTGSVGLVSLIVPFIARGVFGCEFRHQLTGNVCIGVVMLLTCRCLADLIPFVGDGIAIGSLVGIVALPVFLVLMARQTRGWE